MLAASPDDEDVRRRHAEYMLTLARRAEAVMTGADYSLPGEPERRIQEELPNVRAALEWALERDETFALRLAVKASWAWGLSGSSTEGRAWLSRTLDAANDPGSVNAARALAWLGTLAQQDGDFRNSIELVERARELFERHGRQRGVVIALMSLAYASFSMGEVDPARRYVRQARDRATEFGDETLRGEVLATDCLVETGAGNYERAQQALDEALALFRKTGAPRRRWVHQLINVGWIAIHRGDLVRARDALEEYLDAESSKNPVGIANGHGNLGLVAVYECDRDQADSHCRQALAFARAPRAKPTIAEALFVMSAVAAMDGDDERAVRLSAAAAAVKTAMDAPLSAPERHIVETYLEPAGANMPQDTRERARSEGIAMSLDEAVAYALGEADA